MLKLNHLCASSMLKTFLVREKKVVQSVTETSLKLTKFCGTSQWLYRINLCKQSSCTIYSRRTMNYVVMCSHGARCIRNFQNNDYRLFIYVAYIVTASNFPIESNFLNSQRQKPQRTSNSRMLDFSSLSHSLVFVVAISIFLSRPVVRWMKHSSAPLRIHATIHLRKRTIVCWSEIRRRQRNSLDLRNMLGCCNQNSESMDSP